MAEVNFDEIKQGMSMLEVVKAYPEAAVKAMEKMQAELAQLSHNTGSKQALREIAANMNGFASNINQFNSEAIEKAIYEWVRQLLAA
jgi:hypothetical protein